MVNVFSLTELKNASDDTIPVTLAKLGYTQSNTLLDIRLLLGYIGVVAAGLAGAYDYKVGFEKAKGYTLVGVFVYFLFYGAMNAWQFLVERGTVYVGVKDDSIISIKTSTDKTTPTYKLEITLRKGAPTSAQHTVAKHELFTKWFDCDGNLVLEPLTTWLGLVVDKVEKDSASEPKKKR